MSKVVKVYNSDYKVSVQDGGTITLDTGNVTGTTVITGDLEVKGTTTTVESTEVTINDNIIVLSDGTIGSGLPSSVGYKSGIEIDRGTYPQAQWVFYEQISWMLGGDSGQGTWYAPDSTGQTLPLATSGIVLNGAANLYITTGNGVISVTNTNDYEEKIWNYAGAPAVVTPDAVTGQVVVDDDHIPNAKAVKDYVDYVFANETYDRISEGDTVVETIDQYHILNAVIEVGTETTIQTVGEHGFTITDTVDISGISAGGDPIENLNGAGIAITEIINATLFKVNVNTAGGDKLLYAGGGIVSKTGYIEARVKVDVDGVTTANFYDNRFEIHDLKIQGTEISTTASNQDLLLSATGTGSVKVKDILELGPALWDDDGSNTPTAPADGVKIYTTMTADSSGFQAQTPGNTGIYFVNSNENRDEIISKNRALLYGMLF